MDTDKLKAEDLLVRNKTKDQEIVKKVEEAPSIPANYIPVKLSSVGKLGFPAVVHVRDYQFEEALQMAEFTTENITEVIIEILNSVIFEDVDIGEAHRQDVLEILLHIYGTWYSPKLETNKYYVNLDLEGEEREDKSNISVATIPINAIKTTPLPKDSKLPITFKKGDFEVKLILPKVRNEVIASKFVEEKYAEEENELGEIIKRVKSGKYTQKEFSQYQAHLNRKGKDYLRIMQALIIGAFNGKNLDTLEEKIQVLPEIPLSVWSSYRKAVEEHFHFGIEPEVEFMCSINHKPITRRFQFRPFHFIPSLEQRDGSGFDVSLG